MASENKATLTLKDIVFEAIRDARPLTSDFYADARALINAGADPKAGLEHVCQVVNSVCPVSEGPEADIYRPALEFFIEQCGDINAVYFSRSWEFQFNLFHRVAFLCCPLATRVILSKGGDPFVHDQKKRDPRHPLDIALEYGPKWREWSLVTADIIFEAMAERYEHDMPGFYQMLTQWPHKQHRRDHVAQKIKILFADGNHFVPNWRDVLKVLPQRKPQSIQAVPEDDGMATLGVPVPHLRLANYDLD